MGVQQDPADVGRDGLMIVDAGLDQRRQIAPVRGRIAVQPLDRIGADDDAQHRHVDRGARQARQDAGKRHSGPDGDDEALDAVRERRDLGRRLAHSLVTFHAEGNFDPAQRGGVVAGAGDDDVVIARLVLDDFGAGALGRSDFR